MQTTEPMTRGHPEPKFYRAIRNCRIILFLILPDFENLLDIYMNKEHFALKKSLNITVSPRLEQSQSLKKRFCPLKYCTIAASIPLKFRLFYFLEITCAST